MVLVVARGVWGDIRQKFCGICRFWGFGLDRFLVLGICYFDCVFLLAQDWRADFVFFSEFSDLVILLFWGFRVNEILDLL